MVPVGKVVDWEGLNVSVRVLLVLKGRARADTNVVVGRVMAPLTGPGKKKFKPAEDG